MTKQSFRITVIDHEAHAELGEDLAAWLAQRFPGAIVDVRRTVTSVKSEERSER
jgi:hypothetical protein